VQADQLAVNNADGTAVFERQCRGRQGEMRLAAGEVKVSYGADKKSIGRWLATGGVTIANLGDAAEAREAVYTIDRA
jgi:lipopolysaccharide export system protein LptA